MLWYDDGIGKSRSGLRTMEGSLHDAERQEDKKTDRHRERYDDDKTNRDCGRIALDN